MHGLPQTGHNKCNLENGPVSALPVSLLQLIKLLLAASPAECGTRSWPGLPGDELRRGGGQRPPEQEPIPGAALCDSPAATRLLRRPSGRDIHSHCPRLAHPQPPSPRPRRWLRCPSCLLLSPTARGGECPGPAETPRPGGCQEPARRLLPSLPSALLGRTEPARAAPPLRAVRVRALAKGREAGACARPCLSRPHARLARARGLAAAGGRGQRQQSRLLPLGPKQPAPGAASGTAGSPRALPGPCPPCAPGRRPVLPRPQLLQPRRRGRCHPRRRPRRSDRPGG